MTVLLGEDDESIASVVTVILKENGHKVIHAADEKTLLSLLPKKPQLILLDISLAGGDGAALAKKLKHDPLYAEIPIVIVSANNETESIAEQAGANDFLLKPFDLDQLLDMVKRYSA
jgi:CheY-like chemotaxis protein